MKKFTYIFIAFILLSIVGRTQQKPAYGFYTDREVYVSGETMMAKIFLPEDTPSSIACLDLVNQSGTRITGVSLAIHNHEAHGYLELPDSLSSGPYLVRTYLKHNAEKTNTIREIWVSNRFDETEKIIQLKRVVSIEDIEDNKTNQIQISKVDQIIKVNSQVQANVTIDEELLKELDGNLLVSVAQTDQSFAPVAFFIQDETHSDGIIEKKGIILSGTVTDKMNSQPANDVTVYLTIPDSIPGFQYYKTQKDGRFYFLLDKYYGSVQVVIQCFGKLPTQRLTIKTDEFFEPARTMPEFKEQPMSLEFKNNINRNISTVTFRKVFEQEVLTLLPNPEKGMDTYPYYGKASQTVDPQLFIDLPDFTEISRELLPGVKFRNYNNEPSLQIMNTATRNYFEGKPLVLMDGIPVSDLNLIKDLGTTDIHRIDVWQCERFYGDLRFPGVVAIYTTKANDIKLPESSQLLRLKLEAIQLPSVLAQPSKLNPAIPDLRQLIYWDPSTPPARNFLVNYSTSSIEGQFKLMVRGRLKDGTLIYSEKNFEVK